MGFVPGQGASIQMRTTRVTTGSISGAGSANVTVTWATPMPTADYTIAAVAALDANITTPGLLVKTQTTTGCVVRVENRGLVEQTFLLHAIAIHD